MTNQQATEPAETKRSRRQKLAQNDKNRWFQSHPKMQSAEARAKAHIREAGLVPSTTATDDKLDWNAPELKFGRKLASPDLRVRHTTIQQLKHYLTSRSDLHHGVGLAELDLLKLWKGLWFTLYLADKVPVQQELAQQIAELVWCVAGTEEEDEYAGQAYMEMFGEEAGVDYDDVELEEIENTLESDGDEEDEDDEGDSDEVEDAYSDEEEADSEKEEDDSEIAHEDDDNVDSNDANPNDDEPDDSLDDSEVPHCRGAHLAALFVRTFFRTVRREWGNMDKYRVDKFYTLMRLILHQVYKYMAVRHWNIGIIRLFNDAIFEEVLSQQPNGLRYHLMDIVLDELAAVNAQAPMPLTEATFVDCMEPYFALAQTGDGDDIVQRRVVEHVLTKFLTKYSVVREDNDTDDSLVFQQVHVGTIAQFLFEVAGDGATRDGYRKSLYDLYKHYMRRLKEVGRDVDLNVQDDEDEHMEVEDDDAVPELQNSPSEEESEEESNEEVVEKPVVSKKASKGATKKRAVEKEQKQTDVPHRSKQKKERAESDEFEEIADKPKRKRRKRSNSDASDSSTEQISISLLDQKRAKKAMKEKNDPIAQIVAEAKAKKEKKSAADNNGDKRVKFTKSNQSRSFKASMKLLKTRDPPSPASTPESGILRNKNARIPKNEPTKGKKGKRAKAKNFF